MSLKNNLTNSLSNISSNISSKISSNIDKGLTTMSNMKMPTMSKVKMPTMSKVKMPTMSKSIKLPESVSNISFVKTIVQNIGIIILFMLVILSFIVLARVLDLNFSKKEDDEKDFSLIFPIFPKPIQAKLFIYNSSMSRSKSALQPIKNP